MTPSHHKVELVTVKPIPASDQYEGKNHRSSNHPDGHRQPRPIRCASPPGRRYDRRHDSDRTPNLGPRTRPQLTAAPRLWASVGIGGGGHAVAASPILEGLNTAACTWRTGLGAVAKSAGRQNRLN